MLDTATGNGFRQQLAADTASAGGPVRVPDEDAGSIGKTLFDLPGSSDLAVTVVVPKDKLHAAPSQSLVRIISRHDGRKYLGVVTAGPFAEPDGLRGDSPMLTAVATHGGEYLPPYHGRVQVTVLGEELKDGTLTPPRLRPLPNSPVFVLNDKEAADLLKCSGDVRLGLAVGHESVAVGAPSGAKAVFPRHTAVLGTTGGGKSTTVAGLISRARAAGMAVVVLDVEGEYTQMNEPTDHKVMLGGLRDRGLAPEGVPADKMTVYHLIDRDTTNPSHPNRKEFLLQFGRLSPYAAMEILDLSDAQQERFLKAYDIAKEVMRDLGIFPAKGNQEQEQYALEIDEFERGYPRMTLPLLMDVVSACLARADKGPKQAKGKAKDADEDDGDSGPTFVPQTPELRTPDGKAKLSTRINAANPPGNAISWRGVMGRLGRLNRLKVFWGETDPNRDKARDKDAPLPMNYASLLKPGGLSVIDLSDTGYSAMSNLVIADILHGVQEAQELAYVEYEKAKLNGKDKPPPRVLIVVEEAHEFLSEERIAKTPVLFEQVARIAKRGRKRWLGLCFVTQLPAHLPKQVLSLCNSFVLHKLQDPHVVGLLRRTVGGVDEGLWDRLPSLAPGQAVVSFPHFTRPLLVSIDPAMCKLRMAE
ncbi:Uncharacterized protein OS=Roseiflexus sp. (strain RS-1) GN=RoseRS_2256 PE=4 SV=1: DUF87: AAA_10 [Gemmataceae bacterium]|nr:Uncharacterized protein OS=Roseiflexus sp. (strain RS-1) GN=RoseRS_2256 PE=4 SV=1: DUF87: AAA_10 [Gemmataceae bacterium]VTT97839.1 Uncharacterized protein OS=Roseiflexus sp. (strain RS-1) GN=RoseRS_2256 PE=4 SV=1: DUF87: AAA_10 [Gemmataceae bacterium]